MATRRIVGVITIIVTCLIILVGIAWALQRHRQEIAALAGRVAVLEAVLDDYAHVKQDAITAVHGEAYYRDLLARRPQP